MDISSRYEEIDLSLVDRNPDQPRQHFDELGVDKLARSIKSNTLLNAIVVRPHPEIPGRFMIVAGERRWRALQQNGEVKAWVKIYEGKDLAKSYVLSVVENAQRVDLNPIEEAISYQRLHDEERLTWEEIRGITGKDISAMINKLKLLELPEDIQQMVREGKLPQVTALNLAQWKNEKGEMLRMAHDLIAGREPAALHFRKQSVLSEIHVQARLPRTPDQFAVRIVKLAGHVQSMPAVLEAFFALSEAEQIAAIMAINPSVRTKLRQRFKALHRAMEVMSEKMDEYERLARKAAKPAPEPAAAPEPPPIPPPRPSPRPAPAPTPIPAARTAAPPSPPAHHPNGGNGNGNGRRAVLSSPPPEDDDSEEVIEPPKPAPKKPAAPEAFEDRQPLELSHKVIQALFFSGELVRVNLSRRRLMSSVPSGTDPDTLVHNALASMQHRWRTAPRGNEAEQKFIRLIARLRFDLGNLPEMEPAMARAARKDSSPDPIRL